MAETVAKELIRLGDALFAERQAQQSLWQELAWQFYPERADFVDPVPTGREFASHLFDSYPVEARRDLGNSLAANLRPRGQIWFKPAVSDEEVNKNQRAAMWLDMAGGTMRRAMYDVMAQFVDATKIGDHDFVTFGNAVLSVEANLAATSLLYRGWHLRDCAWCDDFMGVTNQLHRKMEYSAQQIARMFSQNGDQVHPDIIRCLQREPHKKFPLRHIMIATEDYREIEGAQSKASQRFPFRSVYVDPTHNTVMRSNGSLTFRYIVPRWQKVAGSAYAVSPATMTALPLARQIQIMARTGLEALEKQVDPALVVRVERLRSDLNLMSGGVTFIDHENDDRQGKVVDPIETGANGVLALQATDQAKLRLSDAMLVSKLQLPQYRAKTAFEVQQLMEEYVRGNIPIYEPVEANYSGPLLTETFNTLMSVGAFGSLEDMPDELSGRDISWTFDNPLQQAAEKAKVQTFAIVSGMLGQAAAIDPSVTNDFDAREAFRDASLGASAPAAWVRDRKKADELVAAQAEATEAAATMAQIGAAGQAGEMAGKGIEAIRGAIGA